LHATEQSRAERGTTARSTRSTDDDEYEFVKKNLDDYDEELGMAPRSRLTTTTALYRTHDETVVRENRRRVQCLLLVCCCLCIIMVGASFGAAWWAVKLAEDDDEPAAVGVRAANDTVPTSAPTSAPTLATTTVSSPTTPVSPIVLANNTPGCPDGNVPVEIVITFDGEPEEIGIALRESTLTAIWGFESGTFKSFSQFLRENYFMVCVSPAVTYTLAITDTQGTGLVSDFLGQGVYGKFAIFYEDGLVSRYNGDCDSDEDGITDCGAFCACEFTLEAGSSSGGCRTDCEANLN